jgi:hypothetical protein
MREHPKTICSTQKLFLFGKIQMVGQFAGNNNGIESSETKWETLNIIDSNIGFTELFLKGITSI